MMSEGVLGLVAQLAESLQARNINYCHWKSNAFLYRSLNGENDLDLLVSKEHASCFCAILHELGFKETLVPDDEELPGVRNYYGLDQNSGRLVHVHAHFQLIMGNDLSKNYRIPLEKEYLACAVNSDLMRVPAAEFELVIFVVRMILKHSTWDAIVMRHGKLTKTEEMELLALATEENLAKVGHVLDQIPGLTRFLFEDCLRALRAGCSTWRRMRIAGDVLKVFESCARYPRWRDLLTKFSRRIWRPILQRVFKSTPKNHFATGGLFVAIVGGDGAGKTTLVNELGDWLAGTYEVKKLHMGKPDWSWSTVAVRGFLKLGTFFRLYSFEGDTYEETFQPHGYPWFIRALCTAHDRYLTFVEGRRFAANGGVVLCDRYSFPGFMQMDGPQCGFAVGRMPPNQALLKAIIRWEAEYYQRIGLPDHLIVLTLDPEIAVQRKQDETETSVRARSSEVWKLDWSRLSASVVNADQSKEEVLSQVKNLLWKNT